jgi:ABC-2 type transport system permease protein
VASARARASASSGSSTLDEVVHLAATYRRLVGARIRADWQYRLSFSLFAAGQFFGSFLDLLAIAVIFNTVPALAGWSLAEVAFLYGTSGVAFNIGDVFISQVERSSQYIKSGNFDQLLLRPLGPLFQLSCREFELRRVGKVTQAAGVLAVAVVAVDVAWTAPRVGMFVVLLVSGTAIFSSIWVATSSIAFWTVETQEVANAFTYGGNFVTQYPIDLFAPWIRRLLLVVPLAFVNYLPAAWILGRADVAYPKWLTWATPAVAVVSVLITRAVWNTAVRHYRSTGS